MNLKEENARILDDCSMITKLLEEERDALKDQVKNYEGNGRSESNTRVEFTDIVPVESSSTQLEMPKKSKSFLSQN